jgi:hypothetical protein
MKRIRLSGWAVLLMAGALAGCHQTRHQGPYYTGWGGCYSHMETDRAVAHIDPSLGVVPPDGNGQRAWSQPPGGAGAR